MVLGLRGRVGGVTGGGGPYWPGGGGAKRRGINLWPLQFCNVLRSCEESGSLEQSSASWGNGTLFSLFIWRATGAVNTVSTHLLVCVFPHCIRLHENHITKNKKNVKEKQRKQGTAAKYTHKKGSIFGDIYNHSVRKKGNESFSMGKDDLQMTYLFVIIFTKISLHFHAVGVFVESVLEYIHSFWGDFSALAFFFFFLTRHPFALSMLRAFHLPDEGSPWQTQSNGAKRRKSIFKKEDFFLVFISSMLAWA